jgi:NitT/TauT family transport system permease protein
VIEINAEPDMTRKPSQSQLRDSEPQTMTQTSALIEGKDKKASRIRTSFRISSKTLKLNLARLGLFAVIILLWQFVSDHWDLSLYMSTPTAVWARTKEWANDGIMWRAIHITLYEAIVGYLLGSVSGAVLGFTLGRARLLGQLLDPLILAAYAVPKIALAPLFVLWLGIGVRTKIGVAALLVFFLVFYNTYSGTKQVDERLCEQARIMGAGRWSVMFKLIVPQAAAWMFVGLSIALPYAITGAVVGEFISSTEGLGYLINNATASFDTAGVYAGLLLLMAIALVLIAILAIIERKFSRWRPQNLAAKEGGA